MEGIKVADTTLDDSVVCGAAVIDAIVDGVVLVGTVTYGAFMN